MKNILGLNQDREQKETQDFLKEYEQLCRKYKRVIIPQIGVQVAKMPEQNNIIQTQEQK